MFVRLWMSPDPVTVTIGQPVSAAMEKMDTGSIRRVPVVDGEQKLVGIISSQDLATMLPSTLDGSSAGSPEHLADNTRVEEIMTEHPVSVEPMTPLEDVARLMRTNKLGGVPVTEQGRLVGIITETDIFRAFDEILGNQEEGTRLEVILSKKNRDFYAVMDIFKRYDIFVQAMTVHHNFGENQRLLTTRVMGDEIDDMLDALRRSGALINRIQGEGEDS